MGNRLILDVYAYENVYWGDTAGIPLGQRRGSAANFTGNYSYSGSPNLLPANTGTCSNLAWALCPLIEGTDSLLGSIYGWVESNFLRVQLSFYDTNRGTYTAWAIFRNIANVLFVIFFLVVMFSQITSIGISNYGIKKMLPEIIIAAVLINLSYFIAQAMIDLSNIIGYQIHSLLVGIARLVIEDSGGTLTTPDGTGGLIAGLALVLGITGGALLIGMILTSGLGALFAVALIFLFSALIAILMLFLLLVVRQVGIIILVVLSPLAFAARILPGTTGLFRTWWKMFTSLLVVYPACGLVIGAGILAGVIIIQGANATTISEINPTAGIFFGSILGTTISGPLSSFGAVAFGNIFALVGMMAMIAPYFAVITIIKGSLSGLGRLGSMVTGGIIGAQMAASRTGERGINAAGKKLGEVTNYTAGKDARLAAKAQRVKEKQMHTKPSLLLAVKACSASCSKPNSTPKILKTVRRWQVSANIMVRQTLVKVNALQISVVKRLRS
jgi:hypothetical protein